MSINNYIATVGLEVHAQLQTESKMYSGDPTTYGNLSNDDFGIKSVKIAQVIKLIDKGEISNSMATQKLFPLLVEQPDKSAVELAEEHDLIQHKDEDVVIDFVKEVLEKDSSEVNRYKVREKKLMASL